MTELLLGSTVAQAASAVGLSPAQASGITRRPDFRDEMAARRQETRETLCDALAVAALEATTKVRAQMRAEGDLDPEGYARGVLRTLATPVTRLAAEAAPAREPNWVRSTREEWGAEVVDAELVDDEPTDWSLL